MDPDDILSHHIIEFLYTAIIDKGIDTRFVLFHGENHELSRGGKPKHRIRRLEEITAWMEKYLK